MNNLTRLILRQSALLLAVALMAFLLVKATPIDPVDNYLGAAMTQASAESRDAIRESLGVSENLVAHFSKWIQGLAKGDLGWSHSFNAPVSDVVAARIGPSVTLAGGAWLLSSLLGYALGLTAALFANRWPDRLITFYAYLMSATPGFWLALIAMAVFSVGLGWTPICCSAPLGMVGDVGFLTRLHHLALPLATLTLLGTAQVALHTRQKGIEIMQSDPVTLSRAHGAGKLTILRRHLWRNAAIPALTASLASAGEIISGTILAEQVFAWPGLGQATITAGLTADVSLLLAITVAMALVVATANLLATLVAPLLDPRLKAQG